MANAASQDADEEPSPLTGDPATAPQVAQASQTTQSDNRPADLTSNPEPLPPGHGLDNYSDMYKTIDFIANADRIWEPICQGGKDEFVAGDRKADRGIAFEVLLRDNVPHTVRARMHIIIACAPGQRLHHAQQAVEEARQGIRFHNAEVEVDKALDVLRRAEQTLNIILDWGVHDDTPSA
ncbi:hypothetical protein M436DRAFT_85126 [Aureobasidium namibiae CBS 147.97]|uniref:Uncharacterized protein n=1 Tax=Aureobasidium namibiae CBS 147.97 TaxID=1043004 RepID=A0A074WDN6_9PEZI|nr:uncharacterized protein M436DRAFT_85126 [Aureobasidium namibiae CBS 147.97]KEQ69649.1 hypothetical protein M436DRAFT_85126 [Aureobasidium namibiae CBS 147.97]